MLNASIKSRSENVFRVNYHSVRLYHFRLLLFRRYLANIPFCLLYDPQSCNLCNTATWKTFDVLPPLPLTGHTSPFVILRISTPAMESDDEQLQTSSFFEDRCYANKSDIIQAVIEFNRKCNRPFRVVSSDKRRYKAVCTQHGCFFVVQFAFSQTFSPPTKFALHSCQVSESSKASRRYATAKQIAVNPAVRDMAMTSGRKVTPVMIQMKLKNEGISATYMNCVHALKRLKLELFGSDIEQYSLIPSYMAELKIRGHEAKLDIVDNEFMRLSVIFREGLQAYKPYSERGISVDGTFMKTSVVGILLVACFRNGNNEIQIIGVGLVSVENEDNWTWFLKFLLSHLQPTPAFVISDRDKGLMKAMQTTAPDVPHFFCFRHLMENFNKKYKSKMLKNLAWILARSRTTVEYEKAVANIASLDSSASAWLQEVGREKWSTAYSPCPRYNTLTSNNVEAVNSVFKGIRSLPVIDCLMGIERYVACKWAENVSKGKGWGVLTPYASRKVDKILAAAKWGEIDECSTSCFIVAIRSGVGNIPVKFAVQFCDKVVRCSCGYFEDVGSPCVHALLALRHYQKIAQHGHVFSRLLEIIDICSRLF